MKISVISPTPRFLLAGPPLFSSIWLSCIPTFMFMFHVHACPQAFRWTPNYSAFLYHLANAHRGATSPRVFPGLPKPRLPFSRVLLPAFLPSLPPSHLPTFTGHLLCSRHRPSDSTANKKQQSLPSWN